MLGLHLAVWVWELCVNVPGLSPAVTRRDFLAFAQRSLSVEAPSLPPSSKIDPNPWLPSPQLCPGDSQATLHRVMLGLNPGLKKPLMGWKWSSVQGTCRVAWQACWQLFPPNKRDTALPQRCGVFMAVHRGMNPLPKGLRPWVCDNLISPLDHDIKRPAVPPGRLY